MQNAGTARRIRIDITESEATSVLSLGLMAPELMRAAQEFPPQVWQETDDIDRIRELLRQRRRIDSDTLTFPQRMARWVDPQLHTGDVQVQFTETGEVVVAGYVQAWRWRQSGLVVLAPRAGAGRLELDFVRLRLGRLPIPTVVFDVASRLVTSLILRGRDIAEISDLTVTGSRLTLEARLHR